MTERLDQGPAGAGDDGGLTVDIENAPETGAHVGIIGHRDPFGDPKTLSSVAENDLLASLTGDHKLDVAARVHDQTSGLQEDHHPRRFLERSAGPDHGNSPVGRPLVIAGG